MLPLAACLDRAAAEVGRKAQVLAWAAAQGLATPGGVVVPASALRDGLAAAGALERARYLEQAAPRLDPRHAVAVAASVAEAVPRPDGLAAAAFAAVGADVVVCRSSAAMEDGRRAAFPGVFASVLGISSPAALAGAMESCWRSAFSAEALRYLLRLRVEPVDLSLALLVQEQVAAPWYGVYAGVDPVTGAGPPVADLGAAPESVAGGAPAPVRARRVAGRWEGVEGDVARSLEEVHAAALLLSRHLGAEVDVEFALAAGGPVILQCRPLTAVGTAAGSWAAGIAGEPGGVAVVERLTTADYGVVLGHAAVVTEEDVSPLGHVAILCRELGVPLVCGVEGARRLAGLPLVVDGGAGTVRVGGPSPAEPAHRRPAPAGPFLAPGELELRVLAEGRPGRDPAAEADRLARRTARAFRQT